MTERTRIVFFETPTNPNMEILDIAAIAGTARAGGALTIVDNTFASPVNQNPLSLGADIVIHSATKYLGGHSKVVKVNYPGLPDFAGHGVAARQMGGFGGMVTFIYDGDAKETAAFVDRLRIFTIAASLGGAESLVTQPITTTHHGMTPQERARRGIVDGMVRLSCGLEETEDLVSDLEQALSG